MPKKVRELKKLLKQRNFVLDPKRGKGSHSYWFHPLLSNPVLLSGQDGKDAKPYQVKDVMDALKELNRLEGSEE